MAQPKLSDVARVAGVSPTTVSRVLNRRGYLSQATIEKVQAAMAEIGYRPNAVARSLQGRQTRMVGIVFPSVAHPFYGQMGAEIESELARADYRVLLCNSDDHPERERAHLDMLLAQQVDGIISGAHSDVVATAQGLPSALVSIDRPGAARFPNVRCDNQQVSRQAVDGMLARGARRPVHLTSSAREGNLRLLGYREAVAAAGLEPQVLRVQRGPHWTEDDAAVAAALDSVPDLDAVFASNDVLAMSVLRWARSRGLSVPEQVQVVGFDGGASTRALVPELSTVVQPYGPMAQQAVARLLHAIDGTPAAEDGDVLPASIHWGGTTR